MYKDMSIGDRIKYLRNKNGYSMGDLEQITGIKKTSWSAYEKGKYEPSASALVKLSSLFKVSTDWILTGLDQSNHISKYNLDFLYVSADDRESYKKQTLELEELTSIGERFHKARLACGFDLNEVSKRSYIPFDILDHFEQADEYNPNELDLMQLACLSVIYGVDLYWLVSGNVRPPAAIIHEDRKQYPPYEFLLDLPSLKDTFPADKIYMGGQPVTKQEQEVLDILSEMEPAKKREAINYLEFLLQSQRSLNSRTSKENNAG